VGWTGLLLGLVSLGCGDRGDDGGSDPRSGGTTGSAVGGSGAGGDTGGGSTGGSADTEGGADTGGSAAGGGGGTGGGGEASEWVNPAPGTSLFLGANFWRIDWEGPQDFFVDGVDWATVENPWLPELVADLAPYRVLRFMDWNLVNEDPNPQADWSTRKQPTESQTSEPIAYEWQIDLCNRAQTDCWLTVPVRADDEFHANLAALVEARLDRRLRVYVELGNEIWNGGFPSGDAAAEVASELGVSGDDQNALIHRGYVFLSIRLWENFSAVLGEGNPRLVKVLAGQAAWDGPCQSHMAALVDPEINPRGILPTAYAIAPYFSGTSIDELASNVPMMGDWVRSEVACAAQQSIPVISYEGGADSFAGDCVGLQHDPAMAQLYRDFLDTIADAGLGGPFTQYTHVGDCWGLKQRTADTIDESPKYQGVLDWLADHS
jgi:hypothetical protein